jgi:predicted Rossmann-fold nucleotide-binding protein
MRSRSLLQSGALALLFWTCCVADNPARTNIFYVGPYKGFENNLTGKDFKRDIDASFRFRKKYPSGFVTIFGGSQLKNQKALSFIRDFSEKWTKKNGGKIPIMTGGGRGAMLAGNEGAKNGGGPSIAYATYFGDSRVPCPPGNADKVYADPTTITDGLIFSSIAIRETMMILHSRAIVFCPGGTGTEWELFQTLETIKSKQLKQVPVLLIGGKEDWSSFENRVSKMEEGGLINSRQIAQLKDEPHLRDLYKYTEGLDVADLIKLIELELTTP